MLADGLKLMITGMGTVFIFLSLMIIIIYLLSKILAPFTSILNEKQTVLSAVSHNRRSGASEDNRAIITTIVTAVHKFREKRQK